MGIVRRARVKIEVSPMDLGRFAHLHRQRCVWGIAEGTVQSDDHLPMTPVTATRTESPCR